MIFKINFDWHYLGPHSLPGRPSFYDGEYDGGDNYDLNNCKHKDVDRCKDLIRWTRDAWAKGRSVEDNHGLRYHPGPMHVLLKPGVALIHGHTLFWSPEKVDKYFEKRTPGAGWFKRMFIIASLDKLRKIWPARYSDEFKQRCFDYADAHDLNTLIMGHRHPTKVADFNYLGVRIIVGKRGLNVFDL